MKKTKIFAVVLASLACAVLLGSCDYWKEDWFKAQGGTVDTESGGESSELHFGPLSDSSKRAAFENEFGAGAWLFFGGNGDLSDGKPHQGRVRAYNLNQGTLLKDGTFQGTFKDQFTFAMNGTAYVGKFRLKSGGSSGDPTAWDMDIYDSSGTTLRCTTTSYGWVHSKPPFSPIWDQPEWQ